MDFPDLGIFDLTYDDAYWVYVGTIHLGGQRLPLYFVLDQDKSAEQVVAESADMLLCVRSQFEWLVNEAQEAVADGEELPAPTSLLVYRDTFDVQFGNSDPNLRRTWFEAMYERHGKLYCFEMNTV